MFEFIAYFILKTFILDIGEIFQQSGRRRKENVAKGNEIIL